MVDEPAKDEPPNLVGVIVRELRAEMREFRARMETKLPKHDRRFDAVVKRLGDVHETAVLSVGFAAMANHKLDRHAERIEDHEQRIIAPEQRP